MVGKIENFFCKYPDTFFGLNLSSSPNTGSEFMYLARKAQNKLILEVPMSKINDPNAIDDLVMVFFKFIAKLSPNSSSAGLR